MPGEPSEKAKQLANKALRALAGFAKALKAPYKDIEVGLDFAPEPGLADNGDLEHDLQALLEAAGAAAQKVDTALALFVDELQYVKEDELAALITALHRAAQRNLPIVLVGAGRPHYAGARAGRSRTRSACSTSPRSEHCRPTQTSWRSASRQRTRASKWMQPRSSASWPRHTATRIGRTVTSLAPTRSALINKGMIWSPNHGDTAFTVPLFDEFMQRIMPGDDWRGPAG